MHPLFPNLNLPPKITSADTDVYNCIAWAFADNSHWWWPRRAFWPVPVASNEPILVAFEKLFAAGGWTLANDGSLEQGFEKIALYASSTGAVTHAARQLPSGEWTSKLGKAEDIVHGIGELDGPKYGSVFWFYKKKT